MIMELIKEISRVDEIKYTDSDSYDTRKLVIFSDLLQNSKNVGLIRSCRDKKKCVTWVGNPIHRSYRRIARGELLLPRNYGKCKYCAMSF